MRENLIIEVETLAYGQPRAYADSRYNFRITVNKDNQDKLVQDFCEKVLYPSKRKGEERAWHESYSTFMKSDNDDKVFTYNVTSPYLD